MNSALRFAIFVGLALWVFLLLEQYMPDRLQKPDIVDANVASRCQKFGQSEEGVHTLTYGDRIKQIVVGCW